MVSKKMKALLERGPRGVGDKKCATCNHENAKAITADVLAWKEARDGGTRFSVAELYDVLSEEHGYNLSITSFARHLKRCLGFKTT